MDSPGAALAISGAIAAWPKNPSWIHGHLWWWQSEDGGMVEKRLLEEYGAVVRWSGTLGEQRLWIADAKAVHHILHAAGYLYEIPSVRREMLVAVLGGGLVAVEGDIHKRQRRAMAPAFGLSEARGSYPYFVRSSNTLTDKWNEVILNAESGQSAIIDVYSWLSKATLDAIGAGTFDYAFGALENSDNKLTKSYTNLTFGAFFARSKGHLFAMETLKFAPNGFLTWMMERDKRPAIARLRENRTYVHEVATKLIEEKRREPKDGASQKDLLSLLVKANSATRQDLRLTDEEVIAQVRTIMFAGHDTTARTLTFALWELAKSRHVQEKLRAEIVETLGQIRARGDRDFTVDDLDSMTYLVAVGKKVLRVNPAGFEVRRAAKKDDVLPLSKPIVGVSGKVYNELFVPAGTMTFVSTIGYNMNKDVWGQDAYEFRPERWLEIDQKPDSPLGIYGNLATFSGGPKSCIGWRFAVIEIHTFLVTLVRQFDFSLPDNGQEVKSVRPGALLPAVVREEHKGPQMPLKVTALRDE